LQKSKKIRDQEFATFPKYVKRQYIARFLAQYEIFKRQLSIKGSVIECGVRTGGGLMTWAKISSTLEPYNYHREIIGFDTFEGFPSVATQDKSKEALPFSVTDNEKYDKPTIGMFSEDFNIMDELNGCIDEYNDNRFLNHIDKVKLVKGDANKTIPKYIDENKHLLVSLLYLDFDIYEPTKTALEHFLPRMSKGSVIGLDEVNNKYWPGETMALLESLNIQNSKIESFPFEPNISFIQL